METNNVVIGKYLCVVCANEFQAPRMRGTPIRMCDKCSAELEKNKQFFCTTCRKKKDKTEQMPSNPNRCRSCHYESSGRQVSTKCLQCGSEGMLVKYSKVCKKCFADNDAKQLKFCVICMKPVPLDKFPESGNVCIPCKNERPILKVESETYHKLVKHCQNKNIPVSKSVNEMILKILEENTNESEERSDDRPNERRSDDSDIEPLD